MFLCLCVYRRYSTSYAGIGEIMKFGFLIDHCKCIGCHACSVACKEEHQVPLGVYRTWVKHVEKGAFPNTRRHFTVLRCNHCEDAPCVTICSDQSIATKAANCSIAITPAGETQS